MPSREEYLGQPVIERVMRLGRTGSELAATIDGRDPAVLGRRPDSLSWSATEILCHLRDVQELFRIRFHTILALDDPKLLTWSADTSDLAAWGIGGPVGNPLDPDRWAEELQYSQCDPNRALDAFYRRRSETSALLASLSDAQWLRGGMHPQRGRVDLGDWVASLGSHDDNHLDQLERALDGRP